MAFKKRSLLAFLPSAWFCVDPLVAVAATEGDAVHTLEVSDGIRMILEDNCQDCHEDGTEKGDVRLDNLDGLSLDARLDLMNRMQEQVYLGQMPPKKKTQPTEAERTDLVKWLSSELNKHNASKLEGKLRYPAYGNAIDHTKLFGGKITEVAYTPARRWLVSPQIFEQRVLGIFGLEGRKQRGCDYGVTNPFLLPDASGVRYYDNGVLDGGHLLVMLTNAEWISQKQIRIARVKAGEIEAGYFHDLKDRWTPKSTPSEFEAIIVRKSPPTEEQVSAAIRKQFQLVLGRDPEPSEMARYISLAKEAIGLAGNTEGLRQMLVAVLLESEFLYRLEFGDGPADIHGRKMLSPHEAAYAISYAIGDRGPDEELLEAASSGKLNSREDYKREVIRLLADQQYYRGQVDPGLNGGYLVSHETSHPRINRFFRDFFGYPMAVKIFKDTERSGGYYQNPGRGSGASPALLVDEADRVIDWHLANDQNLFESLLTTDEFFVYHDLSNEEGAKIIKEWSEVYELLKDSDWKANPKGVIEKNEEFIKERKSMHPLDASRAGELINFMHFFEESFGQCRPPFTKPPWRNGFMGFHHSPMYNLPPSPMDHRYGSWKSTKYNENLELEKFWDYPVNQPFKIGNRMGILTHPAWLISHSKNTHNDPVVRGKWVREKLLAGRVPDVPITVDAQIPEDHHKTLRDRLEMVTLEPACWKCHESMNPLGLPFEIFDDFGRYRKEEPLEHPENVIGKKDKRYDIYKALKINSTGELTGTGDPLLDGEVTDAIDMIGRIAKSDIARQSIIRHAFRFYMGRNETLSDSKTLIDADKAYLESDGSFRAVIVSLLTSDSFIYRK
jgi:mono/diheme cytochrome c family protein